MTTGSVPFPVSSTKTASPDPYEPRTATPPPGDEAPVFRLPDDVERRVNRQELPQRERPLDRLRDDAPRGDQDASGRDDALQVRRDSRDFDRNADRRSDRADRREDRRADKAERRDDRRTEKTERRESRRQEKADRRDSRTETAPQGGGTREEHAPCANTQQAVSQPAANATEQTTGAQAANTQGQASQTATTQNAQTGTCQQTAAAILATTLPVIATANTVASAPAQGGLPLPTIETASATLAATPGPALQAAVQAPVTPLATQATPVAASELSNGQASATQQGGGASNGAPHAAAAPAFGFGGNPAAMPGVPTGVQNPALGQPTYGSTAAIPLAAPGLPATPQPAHTAPSQAAVTPQPASTPGVSPTPGTQPTAIPAVLPHQQATQEPLVASTSRAFGWSPLEAAAQPAAGAAPVLLDHPQVSGVTVPGATTASPATSGLHTSLPRGPVSAHVAVPAHLAQATPEATLAATPQPQVSDLRGLRALRGAPSYGSPVPVSQAHGSPKNVSTAPQVPQAPVGSTSGAPGAITLPEGMVPVANPQPLAGSAPQAVPQATAVPQAPQPVATSRPMPQAEPSLQQPSQPSTLTPVQPALHAAPVQTQAVTPPRPQAQAAAAAPTQATPAPAADSAKVASPLPTSTPEATSEGVAQGATVSDLPLQGGRAVKVAADVLSPSTRANAGAAQGTTVARPATPSRAERTGHSLASAALHAEQHSHGAAATSHVPGLQHLAPAGFAGETSATWRPEGAYRAESPASGTLEQSADQQIKEIKKKVGIADASNEGAMSKTLPETVLRAGLAPLETAPAASKWGEFGLGGSGRSEGGSTFGGGSGNGSSGNGGSGERSGSQSQQEQRRQQQQQTDEARQVAAARMAPAFGSAATGNWANAASGADASSASLMQTTLAPAILQHLERMRRTGSSQMKLTLPLGERGELTVSVKMTAGRVVVRFETDSPDVRRSLEEGWADLTSKASRKGIQLSAPDFGETARPAWTFAGLRKAADNFA